MVINDEVIYTFQFHHEAVREVLLLREGPIEITQARIHNVTAKPFRTPFEISSLNCVLRSSTQAGGQFSPIFTQDKPLTEPFSDAMQIFCTPYIDIENRPSKNPAFVFVEDDMQRSDIYGLAVEPRYDFKTNSQKNRRFTQVAVLFARHPQTVCQINVRGEESIFLRQGESWEAESGIDIALMNCYLERNRQSDVGLLGID